MEDYAGRLRKARELMEQQAVIALQGLTQVAAAQLLGVDEKVSRRKVRSERIWGWGRMALAVRRPASPVSKPLAQPLASPVSIEDTYAEALGPEEVPADVRVRRILSRAIGI